MSKQEKKRWEYKLEIESKRNIRWVIIMGSLVILMGFITSIL